MELAWPDEAGCNLLARLPFRRRIGIADESYDETQHLHSVHGFFMLVMLVFGGGAGKKGNLKKSGGFPPK